MLNVLLGSSIKQINVIQKNRFVDIAPQAVCCMLKGVRPLGRNSTVGSTTAGDDDATASVPEEEVAKWTTKSTKAFVEMTGFSHQLAGHVIGYKPGEVIQYVYWIYMHTALVGVRDGFISAQVSESSPSLKGECWIQT